MSGKPNCRGTVSERFDRSTTHTDNGCIVWTAYVAPDGYARFWARGRKWVAHRFAWIEAHGEIPEGHDVDHLCRNRRCVNLDHLEVVTHRENIVRGHGPRLISERAARVTHCRRGHPYDQENTRWRTKDGCRYRQCRACTRKATT